MKRGQKKRVEKWEKSIPLGSLPFYFSVLFSPSTFFAELFPSYWKWEWRNGQRTIRGMWKDRGDAHGSEGRRYPALFKRFYNNLTMTTGSCYTLTIYADKPLLIFHTNLSKRGKTPGTRLSVDVHIIVAFLKGNACLRTTCLHLLTPKERHG